MDLTFLNEYKASDKLEEYIRAASYLGICHTADTKEGFEDYNRKEKQLISKISTVLDALCQRHPAELRGFFTQQEGLDKNVGDLLQKTVLRFHVAGTDPNPRQFQ